jgi:outer membrane protein OmpA-like peptidoglycan-associated protein
MKNNIMKKIILIIITVFFTHSSFAQLLQNRYEFSIWGGGGISSLHYTPAFGKHEPGYGGFAGIGYNYFFDYHWSLGVGAEFSMLKESLAFPLISDNYLTSDMSNKLLWILVEGRNYKQTQAIYYVNFPLIIRTQLPIEHGHSLYFSAGPKIGIPISSTSSTRGTFTTTGVEVNESLEPVTRDWYSNMNEYGFFSDSLVSASNQSGLLKKNIILAFEAGIKWRISSKCSLYSGIFVDYGLNDIREGDIEKQFFDYNRYQPAGYRMDNVLYSNYNGSPKILDHYVDEARPFVDKVSTIAIGLKLQLSFGGGLFEKKNNIREIYVGNNSPYPYKPSGTIIAQPSAEIMELPKNEQIGLQEKENEEFADLIEDDNLDFEGSIDGFAAFSDNILPKMYPVLDRKAYLLKKHPDVNILIVGHADEDGTDNFNYILGNDRANAVKYYLVSKGIDEKRLVTTTEGRTQPLIPKANETARASNRRVEFVMQPMR